MNNTYWILLYMISDIIIFVSCAIIPYLLICIYRRKDVLFTFLFWLFIVFIFSCGATHMANVIEFFFVKIIVNCVAAIIAVVTSIYLFPLLPKIFKLKTPAEIEKIDEDIYKLNETLKTRISALEAFNRSAAHDLNSPLRALEGFSEILIQDYAGNLDVQGKGYINRIRISAIKMKNLVQDLMRLSNISSAETTQINLQDVSLTNMAKTLIAEIGMADPLRVVDVHVADDIHVWVDPGLFGIALNNLLSNAWKFTRKQPQAIIEVGVKLINGENVYYIKDNGVGFDMSKYHLLFQPFQRLHREIDFEGNGIGLTIVKQIITLHKGRVWAEGEVGLGATFYFTLGTINKNG